MIIINLIDKVCELATVIERLQQCSNVGRQRAECKSGVLTAAHAADGDGGGSEEANAQLTPSV